MKPALPDEHSIELHISYVVSARSGVAFVLLAVMMMSGDALAQESDDTIPGPGSTALAPEERSRAASRVRVAASERYEAGRIHRFAFGGGYRDLWESEVELPLLDLAEEGGGLTPTRRFGGLQTAVLGFSGADGQTYTFRGTDKDPSAVLDELLKDTIIQAVVQDQMAAQHPGGPGAAGVLTEAAGVLTVRERMVVMPDDARLGKFREEFAGMVGTFFVYPEAASDDMPGFHGAIEIIDHEELYERLGRDHVEEVDVRSFLRARLLDLLLGDFDRHRKQWRWARLSGESKWQPIPEDRDMAFVRYDGFGPRLMKIYIPILQRYTPEYPGMKGLTLHGWEQDRWLLPSLSWNEWEGIASEIVAKLDDATIERALEVLPPEYLELDGGRLRHDIRGRRDRLSEAARSFYEHLAREVDIQTSDASDSVRVERHEDGSLGVQVRAKQEQGGNNGRLIFDRRLLANETRDVRLYLRDGHDDVEIVGADCGPTLRIIAAKGPKRVEDRSSGCTRIYDEGRQVEVEAGPGTRVLEKPYVPPPSDSGFVDVENVPPRDWGSDTIPIPQFGFQPDVGVFLGAAVSHTRYGFRKHPWSSKHSLGVGWAFQANAPRVRYQGAFRPENSEIVGSIDLQYSGIEVLRFYGFGNETNDDGRDRFFRVRNQQYRVVPSVTLPLFDEKLHISGGPYAQLSRTFRGARLLDVLDSYGNHDFGVIGARVNMRFDTRRSLASTKTNLELPFHDNPAAGYPTSGFLADLTGHINPPIWDVDDVYGSLEGAVSKYVSVGENDRATLAVRAGGKHVFGKMPFFDAAYIGGGRFFTGSATNRGFRTRRWAGRSALYGNVDLRVVVARLKIIVPGDVGVQGFFDVGRVFLDAENSDNWHPSGGGGVFFSPLVRTNTVSVSVAQSSEETLTYLRFGFHY
jgi:hypothetical protein